MGMEDSTVVLQEVRSSSS